MRSGARITFAAQILQAVSALAMILALAALLTPTDFVVVSLSIGTMQLTAVVTYEWLRLGAMRWFPGPQDETPMRLASIVLNALALSAILVIGLSIIHFGNFSIGILDRNTLVVIILTATFWGLGDLQLILIRFTGRMSQAANLQIIRTILIPALTIPIALIAPSAQLILFGMLAAHFTCSLICFTYFFSRQRVAVFLPTFSITSRLARQGIPAAAASQIHLAVSYGLRLFGVIALPAGSPEAAGFMLALDVVQRPFPILSTLSTALFVPALNKAYDQEDDIAIRLNLRKIYGVLFGGGIIGSFALWTILPAFAHISIAPDTQGPFISFSEILLPYFCALLFLQSGVAVLNQLHRRTFLSFLYSIMHMGSTFSVCIFLEMKGLEWHIILWGAVGAIALTLTVSVWHSKTLHLFEIDKAVILMIVLSVTVNSSMVLLSVPASAMAIVSFVVLCSVAFVLLNRSI